MAYAVKNFKTKKALKEAVAAGALLHGNAVAVYQPGPFGPTVKDGACVIEGPHNPAPHSWYASCQVIDGVIIPGTVK